MKLTLQLRPQQMNNIIQFNLNNYLSNTETLFSDKINHLFEKSAGKTAQESGAQLENVVYKCLHDFKFKHEKSYYMKISEQPSYEDLYNGKSKLDFRVDIFNQPYYVPNWHISKGKVKQINIMIEVKQLGGVQSHFQKLEWFFKHSEKGCLYNFPLLIYDYNTTIKAASKKIDSLNYRIEDVKKTCKKNNINVEAVYLHDIFKNFFNKNYIDNLFLKMA